MRSFSRGRLGRGNVWGLEEVEAEADGIRVHLDEGVVGIHDVEVMAAWEFAAVHGNDAVVFPCKKRAEERD